MDRVEKIKKIGWFHFFILKALVSEPRPLTTKEIGQKLEVFFKIYGIPYSSECRRVIFSQKVQLLIDLGLVEKTKGAVNTYCVKKDCANNAMMLCAGFFGLTEKGGL